MDNRLIEGDSSEILKTLESNSVDSILTDPPAGISFMGKEWDNYGNTNLLGFQDFICSIFMEAIRVLKPGGHALVWAIPRTSHHTAMGLERAGLEIRDVVTHHYGTGFPKSMDISKMIMKKKGDEGIVIGTEVIDVGMQGGSMHSGRKVQREVREVKQATDQDAIDWEGWGTALKPATEHWILCRKPIEEKTIIDNVLKHGTGGINVDVSRIGTEQREYDLIMTSGNFETTGGGKNKKSGKKSVTGRFPSNLILSHSADCQLIGSKKIKGHTGTLNGAWRTGKQYGGGYKGADKEDLGSKIGYTDNDGNETIENWNCVDECPVKKIDQWSGDNGSRFFYITKPSTAERNGGCEKNNHPTVKPISLMRYLIKLITPPKGVVLDMFAGSGTTGIAAKLEGFNYILIEKEPEYCKIAKSRIEAYVREESLFG